MQFKQEICFYKLEWFSNQSVSWSKEEIKDGKSINIHDR